MTLSATATILVICGTFLLIASIIGIIIIKALPSSWFRNAQFHSDSDDKSSATSTRPIHQTFPHNIFYNN